MSSTDLLHQYSDIYNKFGRVGIYTKDERNAIISRFREKKKTRIWKKKIRYTCRKSLADRRVRVKGRFVKTMPGSSMSDERVKGEGQQGRSSDRGDGELRLGIYRAKDEDDDDFYMEEEEEDEEDGEYRNDIINGNVEEDDDDGYLELIDDNAASAALSLLSGSKELMFGTDLDHADDDHDDDGSRDKVSNTLSSSSSSSSISSSPMQFSSNSSNNRYLNDSIHTTSTIVTGRNGYNTRKAIVDVKGLLTPPPPLSCNRDDAEVETIATLPSQKSKKVQQDTVVRSKRIRRHSIAY